MRKHCPNNKNRKLDYKKKKKLKNVTVSCIDLYLKDTCLKHYCITASLLNIRFDVLGAMYHVRLWMDEG